MTETCETAGCANPVAGQGLCLDCGKVWRERISAHWHRRYGRDELAAWKPVRYRLPSGVEAVAFSVSQCRRMKAMGAVKVDAE